MSNYDIDLEKFSDEEKSLRKYAVEQIVTGPFQKKVQMHECMLCQRYSNNDTKGVLVHIVKSHKDILRLIKQCR